MDGKVSHVKTTEGVPLWLVQQKLPEKVLNRRQGEGFKGYIKSQIQDLSSPAFSSRFLFGFPTRWLLSTRPSPPTTLSSPSSSAYTSSSSQSPPSAIASISFSSSAASRMSATFLSSSDPTTRTSCCCCCSASFLPFSPFLSSCSARGGWGEVSVRSR